MKYSRLTIAIFISLILGISVGWVFPDFAIKTHVLAEVFLRMVKMIIAPLLFATLVVGISGHGDVKSLGRLGVKTVVYFEVVTTFALIIGLGFANLFEPGIGININPQSAGLAQVASMAVTSHGTSFGQMFLELFPTSIVKSMAEGNLLQIVVFSLFFALAICAVGKKAKPVVDVLNSVSTIMFKFTEYVMLFAPFGVFAAVSVTIGYNGISVLKSYAKIISVTYFALIVFVILVNN